MSQVVRFLCVSCAISFYSVAPFVAVNAQQKLPFESEIQQFDMLDSTVLYPKGSILFTGSSSIRLWKTLAADMAPYTVIQRGFGGSKMTDLLYYAERIFKNHDCGAVFLFVANDLTGAGTDKCPEEVAGQFADFIRVVRQKRGNIPLFIVAITPTGSRWKAWPQIRKVNQLLAGLADAHENVLFIPTEDLFLGDDGLPRQELYVADRLHLSSTGYELWTKRIRSYLDPVVSCP
ncbi:MAG: GDSL-type esterase/lipase family protein [Saprospiraceae bacterium]|nr:GDSL-type esterase/lipase family protein [Saprospiraceae bacterium]